MVIRVVLHPPRNAVHVVVEELRGGRRLLAHRLPDLLPIHVVARVEALLAEVRHYVRREAGMSDQDRKMLEVLVAVLVLECGPVPHGRGHRRSEDGYAGVRVTRVVHRRAVLELIERGVAELSHRGLAVVRVRLVGRKHLHVLIKVHVAVFVRLGVLLRGFLGGSLRLVLAQFARSGCDHPPPSPASLSTFSSSIARLWRRRSMGSWPCAQVR